MLAQHSTVQHRVLQITIIRESESGTGRPVAPAVRLAPTARYSSTVGSRPPIGISQLAWHGLIKENLSEGINFVIGVVGLSHEKH